MDIQTRNLSSRLGAFALAATFAFAACGAPGAGASESDSASAGGGEEAARSAPDRDGETRSAVVLESGTEIAVELDGTVSTSQSSQGDPFTATVVEPISVDGETVIARGAKVRGTVARAGTVRTEEGEERNVIALAPETIEANGERVPLAAEITSMDVQERDEALTGGDAAIIGGSTAGGAILGAILGDEAGAVAGGMAGLAVSTAIVVANKGTELRVSEGTRMQLALQEDLSVPTGG